jgi:hypothetical protein
MTDGLSEEGFPLYTTLHTLYPSQEIQESDFLLWISNENETLKDHLYTCAIHYMRKQYTELDFHNFIQDMNIDAIKNMEMITYQPSIDYPFL